MSLVVFLFNIETERWAFSKGFYTIFMASDQRMTTDIKSQRKKSDSTKLEFFIQRIVKEEWAKFIWNGDGNIFAHIQDESLILTCHKILFKFPGCLGLHFCKVVTCDSNVATSYWHQIEEGAWLERANLIDKPAWYNHSIWVGYLVGSSLDRGWIPFWTMFHHFTKGTMLLSILWRLNTCALHHRYKWFW